MGNKSVRRSVGSQTILWACMLAILAFTAGTAQANVLNSCTTYCHGMPPRDAARKANPHFNSQSSAFIGNHRNHLTASPVAADCTVCHIAVSTTAFDHGNEIITMANSLKGYSSATIRAKYDKGLFFNQTSIPNLTNATCSNVSCHFEAKTPAWGSSAYIAPANCNACHGFPPAGTVGAPSGGLAGSHSRHNVYYPGTTGCQKCHPVHNGFVHATSAGRPLKVQNFLRDPENTLEAGATYTGGGSNYLPSKSGSQLFGGCTNLYCHSNSGPNATVKLYATPTWNGAVLNCANCHGDMAAISSTAPNGNHYSHASAAYAADSKFSCSVCHGTGYTSASINPATHVNQLVELSFTGSASGTTYSKPAPISAGTVWGNCANSLCHGTGSPVWGGNLWSTTDQCGKCHSSSTVGAITQAAPFYSTSYPAKMTLNTDAKVGAHTNHLTSQSLGISASTACSDCHGSVALTSASHMNGTTNFAWSTLATRAGALSPLYNSATGQCTATYCHGNSMPGGDTAGSNKAPIWKDPTYLPAKLNAAACGLCHGFPPSAASGHPGGITIPAAFPTSANIGTTCSCHSNINASGNSYSNIFLSPVLHINGILETPASGHIFPFSGSMHLSVAGTTPWTACTPCHTNSAGGSYPVISGTAPNCTGCHLQGLRAPSGTSSCWDCHGASATNGQPNGAAFPNIAGSHTVHGVLAGVSCATCHNGGGSGTPSHGSSNGLAATPATVKVTFAGQGTSATWTFASKTCSATNCHGQGGPTWGATVAAPVNGFPYSASQCEKCHSGTATAPFYSTAIPKVTLDTNAKVGAHTSHLTAPDSLATAFACSDCHGTVTLATVTHMNGATNFIWSSLATNNGALAPSYNTTNRSCSNIYCHGASMPGGDTTGTNRTPVWNVPFLPATISAAACSTCHGFPPSTASGHPGGISIPTGFPTSAAIGTTCNCHANINPTGNSYGSIFVNNALHINGVFEPAANGHATNYPGATHMNAVGATDPASNCSACHTNWNVSGPYPAIPTGSAPSCIGCHINGLLRTVATSSCYDCHGSSATDGRPTGNSFPNRQGSSDGHNRETHTKSCTTCHPITTGSTAHGWSKNVSKTTNAQVLPTLNWNPGTRGSGQGSCNPSAGGFSGCHGSETGWY
mgnify:CR=1 FL=1